MPRQQPPSANIFASAAELRVLGATWEAVGKEVRRAARTVRHWPRKYPDQWTAAVIEAERQLASHVDCESVHTLRRLLHSQDEKIRWQAAKILIGRRIERDKIQLRTPPPSRQLSSVASQVIAILEEKSDAELAEIIAVLPPLPALPAASDD